MSRRANPFMLSLELNAWSSSWRGLCGSNDTTSALASTGSDMIYGYIPPSQIKPAHIRFQNSCNVLDLKSTS